MTILKDNDPLQEWAVYNGRQVILIDSVAYFTDFDLQYSGLAVGAYDLANRDTLWFAAIDGIHVGHSKYSNDGASLSPYNDWLVVCGNESEHSYVAVLDRRDGKTLATNLRKPRR